jgi:hypothetical protein
MGEMEKFVGCHIIDTVDKDDVCINQPKLLKNNLGDTKRIYTTPSAPKTLIIRPQADDPLVTPERQKQLRMGVGMLLYLVKHSYPDISNSFRELSKVSDGATEAHFKALLQTVKYVIDTEYLGLLH